jgi:hypothetical protein
MVKRNTWESLAPKSGLNKAADMALPAALKIGS